MNTNIMKVTFLLAVGLFCHNLLAGNPSGKLPQLTTVFEKNRSAKEDIVYCRNKDILRGQVLNDKITLATQYGMLGVPLRRCAGISFEGARTNTEAVVTVNFNRITGIITDRVIKFRIGSSGIEIPIRKEKIRYVLLKQTPDEIDFLKEHEKSDLFVMANGDVLGGESVERKVEILTDDGKIPVSFNEIKNVVMQGGDNVTAVILKTNGDTMRGTLYTEEISLKLEIGLELPVIYKDKFAKIFVDQARKQAPVQFGMQLPIGGESDGVMPVAFDGETITNSIGMNLVSIKPGGFWMGSSGSEKGHDKNESPQHLVKLTKGFYMGATEVSQAQWLKVMRSRPWSGKDNVREGENYPATYVSWNDAVEFCKKLSQTEGRKYRLPTEAEWEYACRADTKTAYSFGDSDSSLGDYAWFNNNANAADEKYAHAVAQKKPNPWGLYGLHGNVWEWCGDWYGENTYLPRQVIDPNGPSSGKYRILRGGSWLTYPEHCRSAHRSRYSPVKRINLIGFRIVLDLN